MTTYPHKTDFYKDGYSRIEFCTVCGQEWPNMSPFCVEPTPDENQLELFSSNIEKDIDTHSEQS